MKLEHIAIHNLRGMLDATISVFDYTRVGGGAATLNSPEGRAYSSARRACERCQ
jgi:hypothetical protein